VELATQFHQQGNQAEAIVHQQAATIMAPTAPAYLNLALLLRDAGRREEALQQARLGAALVPDDGRAQALVLELARR
jgi:hypothetical protein